MAVPSILWSIFKPMLTTRIGAYVALAAIMICGSAYGGWHYRGLTAESDQLEATRVAIEDFEKQALIDDRFLREVEVIKTIIVEKEIEVFRDAVKTDLCSDSRPTADFIRLFDKSIGYANQTPATKLDGGSARIRGLVIP